MIKKYNNYYHLTTKNLSYIFRISDNGDLEHIYYGLKLHDDDINKIAGERNALLVNTLYPDNKINYGIDAMNFEYSFSFRGDSRSCSLNLLSQNGCVFDFVYEEAYICNKLPDIGMPYPLNADVNLCVILRDSCRNLIMELWYTVYEDFDIISRFCRLINNSGAEIVVNKIMSAQYDFKTYDMEMMTFNGAWGRERQPNCIPLKSGKFNFGSYCGMSSAEINPYFIVKNINANETNGIVYGFNLMYSGSHEIGAEITPYGGLRITHGVQSENFSLKLRSGEVMDTPVSLASYSERGLNGISYNFHKFINRNIRKSQTIPIMLNSWETVYFDIDENKLHKLALSAKDIGFEGIVIDDGWFGNRNNDFTSLGDWEENKAKFPEGIKNYADFLSRINMKLGIWIEPEMISVSSNLYKHHPDWALRTPNIRDIVGRNQYIMDLTNKEVIEYVIGTLKRIISLYGVRYIKWDFNRRFADVKGGEGSAYFYRYVQGLYAVLKVITDEYPYLIIENCASGGGRFDLGMITYCSLGWLSDNTEPLTRAEIQEGTSYGYPISLMLNHIADTPSHQTQRISSLKTRLDTAYTGILGAQLDVGKLNPEEKNSIKSKLIEYKSDRNWLITAIFYRLSSDKNYHIWQIMSDDGDRGFIYLMLKRFYTVLELPDIKFVDLDPNSRYKISGEGIEKEMFGTALMRAGLVLPQNYQGVSMEKNNLFLTDLSTLIIRFNKSGE